MPGRSAGHFPKFNDTVLEGLLHKYAKVYLDDVVVYSEDYETHRCHLARVFERLQLHSLRAGKI